MQNWRPVSDLLGATGHQQENYIPQPVGATFTLKARTNGGEYLISYWSVRPLESLNESIVSTEDCVEA